MKKIICFIFACFIFISVPSSAYADTPSSFGLLKGTRRPNWTKQYEYIVSNSCEAVGVIPYHGDVYYRCPNGEVFWSDIMTPIPSIPPSSYVKNKAKKDSDDETTNVAVASSMSYSYSGY